MKLIDSFVQDLEGVLSVKRTEISLAEMWRNNGPNSTGGTELSDYLATVSFNAKYFQLSLLISAGGHIAVL